MPLASAAGTNAVEGRGQEGFQVHRTDIEAQLAAENGRDVEEILDQARLLLGVARDRVDGAVDHVGVPPRGAEHVGPAQDGVQGGPELVGQGRQEVVLRTVGSLGVRPGPLRARQELLALLFDPPPLGDVARDLGRADDPSRAVADRARR